MLWVELQGFVVVDEGLIEFPLFLEDKAELGVDVGFLRVEIARLLRRFQCLVETAEMAMSSLAIAVSAAAVPPIVEAEIESAAVVVVAIERVKRSLEVVPTPT